MQMYGQTGVGAPAPLPPEPPKKKKGGKVLMILGIILLIVGVLIMVVGWPMFGTDSPEDIKKQIESGDLAVGDSFKMKGKVSDSTSLLGISVIYLEDFEMETIEYDDYGIPTGETTMEPMPLATSGTFSKGDTVIVEGEVGGLEYTVSKVPGGLAIFGIILLLVGVILAIVGVVKGKKKAKEAAPPVGAPPMGLPPQAPGYPPQQPGYPPQQPGYPPQQPGYPPQQPGYQQQPGYPPQQPGYPPQQPPQYPGY